MNRMNDDSAGKRITIYVTEKTHQLMKERAKIKGVSLSKMISDWVWEEANASMTRSTEVKLKSDTFDRLLDISEMKHTTPSQAVSDWIWKTKVPSSVMRGQTSLFSANEKDKEEE